MLKNHNNSIIAQKTKKIKTFITKNQKTGILSKNPIKSTKINDSNASETHRDIHKTYLRASPGEFPQLNE